ncbi:hypothetical protein PHMEG_0002023 [Phytophthora megakarya]|uniref:Uncharacterized protein n=1 Tax=Phytophthora megakarya TaxID=4795 RepID=A0A225WZ45_9STRA|nr:hypothetical protein PHMEG_0002023 [Phytophthora megakarya]
MTYVSLPPSPSSRENPLSSASLLSQLLVLWFQPLVSLGARRPLSFSDLWPVCASDACAALQRRFSAVYDAPSPLAATFLRVFRRPMLLVLLNYCLYVAAMALQSYVAQALLDFLNGRVNVFRVSNGYGLVALMAFVSVVAITCRNFAFFLSSRVGVNMRSLVMSCIFQKSLRLSSAARQQYTTGEVLTLMSVDAERVFSAMMQGPWLLIAPLAFIVCLVLIGLLLDAASALCGFAVLVLVVTLSIRQAKRISAIQHQLLNVVDKRVKVTSEALQGVRVMKFYAWEQAIVHRVHKIRATEVSLFRSLHRYMVSNAVLLFLTPVFLSGSTLGLYVLLHDVISVTDAFTLVALVNICRAVVNEFTTALAALSQARSSFYRLDKFMASDEFKAREDDQPAGSRGAIQALNVHAMWPAASGADAEMEDASVDSSVDSRAAPSGVLLSDSSTFSLKGLSLDIEPGSLVMIVGTVGSGKSSFLNVLLGEMMLCSGELHVNGSISYVSQEPWIRNSSVKSNILFESAFDAERYKRVLAASQLSLDLDALPNGDQTEIGERGINLSGGQKARVAIARAFYRSQYDIMILDDPLTIETTLAFVHGGYTQYTQRCLLSVYFVQFFSFLYMIWLIVRLKIGGRKYENVQGQFVTSPVYQRLKRIMIVYAMFSLQFQLASVVMYASTDNEDKLLDFISVSLIVYHLSGLALAVTTMCSQACVFGMFRSCLPDDIEAQVQARFMQGDLLSPRDTQVLMESAEPPLVNPVFVFTDIESSSALWAMGDGLVMQRATEIHDNILRASLMKYRGYEITTAGDAFQLAFHTELHGMLPSTRKQRAGHRLIFGGLRVRMGIHDAVEADGALILDVHAVTGKMIYTGASEVIANEIGDLGDGGQILVTKRVADWLVMYEDLVAIDFIVERVGEYSISQIKAKLEVYQVLPEVLNRANIVAMVWTTLAITSMGLSCVATGITSYSLHHSWDLQVSSVRWLFFIFFTCYCLYGAARVAYMVTVSAKATWGHSANDEYLAEHYTTLGIFAPLHSRVSNDPLVTIFMVLGDSIHFSVATWLFPLIYELGLIARKTMDRGAEKEKEQIHWYLWVIWPIIGAFTVAETILAVVKGGYTRTTQAFQLAVYFTMFASFLYMLFVVLRLKWVGRKYENVQGQFITSPVYQRISRILTIYAIFTLQYQLASTISYSMPDERDVLSNYTSISTVIYNISGLALAITTMCSQTCVLQMCRCCMPDDVEAQVEARLMQPGELMSPRDTQIIVESAEPPLVNPVFVFTDIQQSSALWGVGDGLIMQRATEIHDNILRSSLMKYRGYEITTAGDAFQLAFHTTREAVEYCMDVQLQLLDAPWPDELHVDSDGTLVLDVHAVTGKMIYTGASEVIANEIGDLGDGGQILVTKRVADWIDMYADLVAIPCSVDRVGDYTVPQINSKVEVFQVLPTVLAKRKKKFTTTFATTLKRRPGHGPNPATGAASFTANDVVTPPGLSSVAAERRRNLYAQRERRRQLEQGALSRPASHQILVRAESSRPSFAFDTRPSYALGPFFLYASTNAAKILRMVWTSLAIVTMGLSCVATGITSYSLRRSWDLQISSVRWLFFIFFLCYFVFSLGRVIYLIVGVINPLETTTEVGAQLLSNRYSKLGVFSVLHFKVSHNAFVTILLVLGDCGLFAVAVWTFPLAYELGLIASRSMDRGAEKEKEQIRWYFWRVWIIIAVFVLVETVLAAAKKGYTTYTQRCLLVVYFTQFLSFLYMVFLVVRLKWGGRKYENVQGHFVTSPIYQRLSRIMIIYAIFTMQFQVSTVVLYSMPEREYKLIDFMSVSSVIYCASGLALSITTMFSQACVLEFCRWCLPDDVEAQVEARLMQPGELLSPRDTLVLVESTEPPLVNPVFVFTDIQQSSALWGVGDGLIMQQATEIHDNILRSSLMKYRGYEITTAGDAFQLAFHTVREAIEYCLDVQMQLLVADWPKELHGLLPATKKQRWGHHVIFCGLRVRMGIHDAVDLDGPLVLDVHAVTGKMTYTGASVVIANEIGDLGDGGQILVTRRVADWLIMYADLVVIPCCTDRVGEYTVPLINATVEVFQVVPIELARRKKKFTTTLKKRVTAYGSAHSLNDLTPPGLSFAAAERRRNLYARRERRRQLEQGALGRHASHTLIAVDSAFLSEDIGSSTL